MLIKVLQIVVFRRLRVKSETKGKRKKLTGAKRKDPVENALAARINAVIATIDTTDPAASAKFVKDMHLAVSSALKMAVLDSSAHGASSPGTEDETKGERSGGHLGGQGEDEQEYDSPSSEDDLVQLERELLQGEEATQDDKDVVDRLGRGGWPPEFFALGMRI